MTPYWTEYEKGKLTYDEAIDAFAGTDPEIKDELHKAYDSCSGIMGKYDYTQGWIKTLKEGGFKLLPYDEVVVRRSPSYSEQKNVTITGCVNFEGQYSLTSKNFRLSDLVKAAGGVTSLAYTKGARLNRVMTPDERLQRESSLRAAQIQLIEESMSSDKEFNKAQADTLLQMKMDLGRSF